MEHQFTGVWYATERRMQSLSKWKYYDRQGTLKLQPDGLRFHNKNTDFSLREIQRLSLTQQRVPWITVMLSNVLLLIIYTAPQLLPIFMLAKTLGTEVGMMFIFGCWPLIPLILLCTLLNVLAWRNVKWILVEHVGENNELQRAYFAPVGWGAWFGNTTQMLATMQSLLAIQALQRRVDALEARIQ